MKNKNQITDLNIPIVANEEKDDFPGYPLYPPSDDIYKKFHKEIDINPEDISSNKKPVIIEKEGALNAKNFEDNVSGNDLDILGSELDDDQEMIGNEDEENNYYSIGGDNHNDLEENKEI